MSSIKKEILEKIALTPKGERRAKMLENEEIRNSVLNSGANVLLYTGDIKQNEENIIKKLENIYVGVILRKNKKGNFDGLGALGGLAERTKEDEFYALSLEMRKKLIGVKDDVILENNEAKLITDMDVIRKNNVLREMKEELDDLGISDVVIDKDKLKLIDMPNLRDDNYMINIWNGMGDCFAITPYCHIYKDEDGIIDKILENHSSKQNGEVACFKKIKLIDALDCFGNQKGEFQLEDGRDAKKDFRYPHEYLALWGLAGRFVKGDDIVELALNIQERSNHMVSFREIAKRTKQSIEDIAVSVNVDTDTLLCMENAMHRVYKHKNNIGIVKSIQNYWNNLR